MHRVCWLAGSLLWLAGCTSAQEERIHDYRADGMRLYRQGQYAGAAESFDAALALKPQDKNLLYNAGQCYDHLGKFDKAERYYNSCLKQEPNHATCRHALTSMLVRQGRWSDAVHMVSDWLAREPKLSAALAEDAWLWYQEGDLPKAEARLLQALEQDRHNTLALVELALVYEALHYPDRAREFYERALAVNPDQPDVVRRLNQLIARGVKRPHPE